MGAREGGRSSKRGKAYIGVCVDSSIRIKVNPEMKIGARDMTLYSMKIQKPRPSSKHKHTTRSKFFKRGFW